MDLAQRMGYSSWEDVYVGLGNGTLTVLQVANKLQDEYQKNHPAPDSVESLLASKANKEIHRKNTVSGGSSEGVIVDGFDGVPIRFAHCCKPLPGDGIVGYPVLCR